MHTAKINDGWIPGLIFAFDGVYQKIYLVK